MGLGRLLARRGDDDPRGAGGAHTRAAVPLGQLVLDTGAPTAAGVPVSPASALRLPAVAAAVRLLADSIAMLPLDVFRDGAEVDPPRLLVEPAAGTSLPEWVGQGMRSLLLHGDAFGVIVARSGRWLTPAQVELVDPGAVSVYRDEHGAVVYRVGGREVPRPDVWHVKGPSEPGALRGTSPVALARESIGLGLAAERYAAEFFSSGAVPTAVLKSLDPHLDGPGAEALKAAVIRSQRTRSPLVLNPATEYESVSSSPEEALLVEVQRWVVGQVARAFGLPPELLGVDSGGSLTYANVESRSVDLLKYSVAPWLVRLESALARLLPAGHRVRFNVDALLRTTTAERYAAHEVALRAGFLTVAEVRALEDLPPLPAGGAAA